MNSVKIIRVEETASTNTDLKEMALSGAAEGTVLIAERQTAGRGRLGRQFFSPEGTGCYMSILLRPDIPAKKVTLLTPMTAVAVCEAIEAVTGESPGIKWVNDIFLGGKKVAGILTEGSFTGDRVGFAIVGIGINLTEPTGGFPEEIRKIAGGIGEKAKEKKEALIEEILRRFFCYYESLGGGDFLAAYRDRLFMLGCDLIVHSGEGSFPAKAVDINENCGLIVETSDGRRMLLDSGEVSVRL